MNIEEKVLYISLIFQFQILLFILELTVCRGNSFSLLHNPTIFLNFYCQHKGLRLYVIKCVKMM